MRVRVIAVLVCLTLAGFSRAIAQDMLVTNLADLAEQAFSGVYSLYVPFSPWEWHGYSMRVWI